MLRILFALLIISLPLQAIAERWELDANARLRNADADIDGSGNILAFEFSHIEDKVFIAFRQILAICILRLELSFEMCL